MQIPISIERLIKILLTKVPQEHLIGLDTITLVDKVSHGKNQKAGGLYWQKREQEPAKIEIGVNTIYNGMPMLVFYLPFIAKFMLASVLYHEIGHHYQYFTHGVTKKAEENFAENYKKQMLRKTFFGWRLLLLPLSPLVSWLRNRSGKGKAEK